MQPVQQLSPELTHALWDAYRETKGLLDELEKKIALLTGKRTRTPAENARLKELGDFAEPVRLSLGPIGYVLYHTDESARIVYPEFERMYGES